MANGFGEGPAVMFGLRQSRADAMIMMAVESHPPELIPRIVSAFRDGAQVVQCVRDSFTGRARYRDAATALFVPAIRLAGGFDYMQQNAYYRLVSRQFAQRILAAPRYWRFLIPTPRRSIRSAAHHPYEHGGARGGNESVHPDASLGIGVRRLHDLDHRTPDDRADVAARGGRGCSRVLRFRRRRRDRRRRRGMALVSLSLAAHGRSHRQARRRRIRRAGHSPVLQRAAGTSR